MRRRQMMQKVSRISLCVVIGLLFLALIWKFAGAQLAKKGIVLSNDTAAKTVSETAPEAEDGSGNAGIKKLAETTPPNAGMAVQLVGLVVRNGCHNVLRQRLGRYRRKPVPF